MFNVCRRSEMFPCSCGNENIWVRYAELAACEGDLRNRALGELPVLLLSFTPQKGIGISGITFGVLVYGNFALSFTLYFLIEVVILLTDMCCMSLELS